jgi:hypothetical protein
MLNAVYASWRFSQRHNGTSNPRVFLRASATGAVVGGLGGALWYAVRPH